MEDVDEPRAQYYRVLFLTVHDIALRGASSETSIAFSAIRSHGALFTCFLGLLEGPVIETHGLRQCMKHTVDVTSLKAQRAVMKTNPITTKRIKVRIQYNYLSSALKWSFARRVAFCCDFARSEAPFSASRNPFENFNHVDSFHREQSTTTRTSPTAPTTDPRVPSTVQLLDLIVIVILFLLHPVMAGLPPRHESQTGRVGLEPIRSAPTIVRLERAAAAAGAGS